MLGVMATIGRTGKPFHIIVNIIMQAEKVVLVIALLLVTALINPIDQRSSQQQYSFARENAINTTQIPQIYNFTSSPPAPGGSELKILKVSKLRLP
jgi:hypothetical protein